MICENCKQDTNRVVVVKTPEDHVELWCTPCRNSLLDPINPSTMIATDSIPGGYFVRHGVCNEDGSPRRYDSKSEIRKAAYEKGLTIQGETPKLNPRLVDQEPAKVERMKILNAQPD